MEGKNGKGWWARLAERPIRGPRRLTEAVARAARWLTPGWNDLVGVDVSESSVKLVRVRRRGGARVTVAARSVGAEAKGGSKWTRAADALRVLVAETGWRGAMAATAIGGNDVVVRRFSLPEM